MKEDMHKSVTSKKQTWQWSSEGRDFCEIPSDKDAKNMRIKILLNLEQCTEDHDNERMDKNVIADNRDLYDSENEETEYKILLDTIPKNACLKNTMVSDYCEKKDDEKEENENKAEQKDGWKCEEMEKDEEKPALAVIVSYDNDKMEKFEAECLEAKEERQLESDDIGDGLHILQYARCHSKEVMGVNEDKKNEGKKKYPALMLDEGRSEAETGDQLDKVVTESGFYEELESFGLDNTNEVEVVEIMKNHLILKCPVVLDTENPGFGSEFEILTDDGNCKVSSSAACELIDSKQSVGEVGNFIVTEADLCELLEFSENQENAEKNTRNPGVTNVADENVKDQFRGSVYSREDLVMLKSEFLSFTYPVVCCSNTDWYEEQGSSWKNVSNFSVTDKGPEIQNCVRCHGGNGSNKGNSSNGNGENSNSTSDHQSGCTSFTGCFSNCSGGGGCAGGSGGDDGDKWKKESFCHSDVNDERKTKQTKEIKKKSRLEKADLTGSYNSDPVVRYASEEDLREMSTKWQERAENLRKNGAAQSLLEPCQNEGIVLNQYKAQFLITGNSYSAEHEWFIVTDESLGTKHGSSAAAEDVHCLKRGTTGKCYPCTDINTKTNFCVKQISLCDFYASEIIILMDLDHPSVVKLYGAIFTEDTVFIMMELITGPTLQEYIMEESKLDCPTALHYTKELLEVLAYLYKEGIIHDDIKADNIMLRNGSTVVIDFGLAKRKPYVEAGTVPFGNQCGMSPEKATSIGYDTRADVWAAIAVLVHMISGSMPWSRRFEHKAMLHLIIAELSPPLEDVPANIPPEVRSLIESGWTVDGKKRPFAHDILSHPAFQYSSEYCQETSDNNETDSEDLIVYLRAGDMWLEEAELILASSERNVNN